MVTPEPLLKPVERFAQNLAICAPTISQRAALASFDASADLDAIRDIYAANRRLLLDRLPKMGFEDLFPVDGAFYVYASVRRFSNDSLQFTSRMLAEAGVAATPGHDFDEQRGSRFVRFSFAGNNADMAEGMDRLSHWLK
jgi:aspartate/methionine/tyrosine aminotransferase